MTRFAKSLLAAMICLSTPLGVSVPARAADLVYAPDTGYDAGVCAEQRFLNRIVSRFSYQVRHVPNLPDVGIVDFQRIHENRYQPASETWPIGRRYCGATVTLSDGRDRAIWYLIEEGQGFASIGDNVEFCVSGFDRWMVYNGRCRVLH